MLRVWSPGLSPTTVESKPVGKTPGMLAAPAYSLKIKYVRRKDKKVVVEKNGSIVIGRISEYNPNLDEWIRENGEFCEELFRKRLFNGLHDMLAK